MSGNAARSSFDERPNTSATDGRERRPGTLHYSFFARNLPSQAVNVFGHDSVRGLWKRMAAKEQLEIGRRTMLKAPKRDVPVSSRHGGRLPALPPRSAHKWSICEEAVERASRPHTTSERSRSEHVSILEMSGKLKDEGCPHEKKQQIKEDIREGLRVIILGEAASEEPRTKRMAALIVEEKPQIVSNPTIEETLHIYKKYQELLEMDKEAVFEDASEMNDNDDDNEEDDLPNQQRCRAVTAIESGFCKELMPVSWASFSGWIQREVDFAGHFRYKAVCSAFLRSVKRWKQWEATPQQRDYGVSLNMVLQWTFPNISHQGVAQMLTWISNYELEQIRQPTPRVIEPQSRRQLEGVFKVMDSTGRGYLNADDIAGGPNQDVTQQLKNIVDAETVRNVCGAGGITHITQDDFLEMFCEDSCRAHEDSKQAYLQDGTKLALVEHPIVGFSGWVYDCPPKEEESQRLLISALEAEVMRWRKMAMSRKTKLFAGVLQDAVQREGLGIPTACI